MMTRPFILRPTLRGMAAGSLFVMSLGAAAQTGPAPAAETLNTAFKRADVDADGKISKEEAAKFPALAEQFAQADKDGDGYLSAAEFMAAYELKK